MKIDLQYYQRQRCKHVELGQFWHAFASRGFVSDSWAFLFLLLAEIARLQISAFYATVIGQASVTVISLASVVSMAWVPGRGRQTIQC